MNLTSKVVAGKLKKWEPANWTEFLEKSIEKKLEDEPSNYSEEIAAFNQFRSDCLNSGRDKVAKDVIIRYFCQMEYLELHFEFDESLLPEFSWY